MADSADVEQAIAAAHAAFQTWRTVPAPVRGALVKRLGQLLTEHKSDLADLIGVEVGKIRSEALGEVQEMIDICDFAVGCLAPARRPDHAVRAARAPADGDLAPGRGGRGHLRVQLPRRGLGVEHRPRAGLRRHRDLEAVGDHPAGRGRRPPRCSTQAAAELDAPENLNTVVVTDADGAAPLIDSPLVPVVSATGSERMGAEIAPRIAARFGRAILELGGNNAAVVTPSADLDLAVRGIVFAAAGTAGQRCTSLRRLIVHESLADTVVERVAERLPRPAGRRPVRRRGPRRAADQRARPTRPWPRALRAGRGGRRSGRRRR